MTFIKLFREVEACKFQRQENSFDKLQKGSIINIELDHRYFFSTERELSIKDLINLTISVL